MAPKKATLTSKALQALLTRIGSASSGTKSALLRRFQRDLPRVYGFCPQSAEIAPQLESRSRKVRVISIDMGIKNLAFCDAEIAYPSPVPKSKQSLDATMQVMRWKKLDLVEVTSRDSRQDPEAAEEDISQFSPSVLSKTAYKLITEEVLNVNPDVILIEKQRWRSGGGSAVQQWTVRVNTLEAMLWAVLETVKRTQQFRSGSTEALATKTFEVRAVDPKRVGQYWLGRHTQALSEREQGADHALAERAEAPDAVDDATDTSAKKPSRSKAEKSAKIAVLRSWLAQDAMSTAPSTPTRTPHITFRIDAGAEATRQALLRIAKAPRRKKALKAAKSRGEDGGVVEEGPAAEMKKLDDVADCFLQAAAWVAWESNRMQLLAAVDGDTTVSSAAVDEAAIAKMIEDVGSA
ncbi:ribonuclease H-like protein [Didymella exigua CBS 183.55]|uniref:Ribonuclease H-like protein n=1 Tax=Didymella exigua CBS 183.55 TaxID=1150837 RepID=A0A6A5RNC6_9PLEO|nr:ribonuclease H-like protein [Didymella exigua CBS 183.55]KAF1928638.1 ribonuclease H-like protein [Didymella exigua CBS 183.55]